MTDSDAIKLVAGYATRTLNESEERRLFRPAAEEQTVFEAILEADELRDVLDDAASRRRILRALAPPSGQLGLHGALAGRPALYGPAGAVAMAAICSVALHFQTPHQSQSFVAPLSAGFSPHLDVSQIGTPRRVATDTIVDPLFILPPQQAIQVEVGLDKDGLQPAYGLGERMRIGFRVRSNSNAVLIEVHNDGSTIRLFPNRFMSSSLVEADRQVLIPPAGQGDLEVGGMPGSRRLRLIVTPLAVDPLTVNIPEMTALAGKVTIVEKEYSVKGIQGKE